MSVDVRTIRPDLAMFANRLETPSPMMDRRQSQPEGRILVAWSLFGRPSDLILAKRFAERLGIVVRWSIPTKREVAIKGKENMATATKGT